MDLTIHHQILLAGFVLALILGAVVNKTNFCTMGAVSDWVNMGDKGRFRSWVLAIAVSMLGVIVMETAGMIDLDSMELKDLRPPYRMASFEWLRYILGGLIFGIGMTLASGCANKTLIRVGGGNIKSIFVLLIASFFAYAMAIGTMYGDVFYPWIDPTKVDLAASGIEGQDLGRVVAGVTGAEDAVNLRLIMGGIIVAALMFFVWKSEDFRKSLDNILGGIVVGLCVIGAWWVTAGPWGMEWLEETMMMDTPPRGVGAQAFSFTSPMGDTFNYVKNGFGASFLTFGVVVLAGVILGSFLWAIVSRSFRIEWFNSWKDFIAHAIGAMMMGIGGVLALGCTIGQGVTGMSTMAIGSLISFIFIILGSALTMKVQLYKMMYEDASLFSALITALVDLKLLPSGMRKLEAI